MKNRVLMIFLAWAMCISCATAGVKDTDTSIFSITDDKINTDSIHNGPIRLEWPDKTLKAVGKVKNGLKSGIWKFYYEGSGGQKILASGSYADNAKTGEWFEYYPTGSLYRKIHYLNGEYNGPVVIFYNTGIAHTQIWYRNGVKNGKFQEYYRDGKPKEISFFREGKLHGQTNLYYPDGRKQAIGSYTNGEKSGTWTIYSRSGKIMERGNYSKGKRTGTWLLFNENGEKTAEKNY